MFPSCVQFLLKAVYNRWESFVLIFRETPILALFLPIAFQNPDNSKHPETLFLIASTGDINTSFQHVTLDNELPALDRNVSPRQFLKGNVANTFKRQGKCWIYSFQNLECLIDFDCIVSRYVVSTSNLGSGLWWLPVMFKNQSTITIHC